MMFLSDLALYVHLAFYAAHALLIVLTDYGNNIGIMPTLPPKAMYAFDWVGTGVIIFGQFIFGSHCYTPTARTVMPLLGLSGIPVVLMLDPSPGKDAGKD